MGKSTVKSLKNNAAMLPSKQRVACSNHAGIAISITATIARLRLFSHSKNSASNFTHIHSITRGNSASIREVFGEFTGLHYSAGTCGAL